MTSDLDPVVYIQSMAVVDERAVVAHDDPEAYLRYWIGHVAGEMYDYIETVKTHAPLPWTAHTHEGYDLLVMGRRITSHCYLYDYDAAHAEMMRALEGKSNGTI